MAGRSLVATLLFFGCGNTPLLPSQPDAAPGTFALSDCLGCMQPACMEQLVECDQDPGCAGWFACVRNCPVGSSGDADPACEIACAQPVSTVGRSALAALASCRDYGAGASCVACGKSSASGGNQNPILLQQCTDSMDPNDCYRCDDLHCCHTTAACMADANCTGLKSCLQGCGTDNACQSACYTTWAAGLPIYAPRFACVKALCSKECGAPQDPCSQCLNGSCIGVFTDCEADPGCYLLQVCMEACSGPLQTCWTSCSAMHPQSVELFSTAFLCLTNACMAVCGS